MDYRLLKPLLVFCSQSQSQKYIKTIKNLGDTWRTLPDEPEINQNTTVIETTFDFILKITKKAEPKCDPEPVSIEIQTLDETPPSTATSSTAVEEKPVRHYRIFSDYGTDFIWRSLDDIRPGEGSHVESGEVLSSFPPSVLELYNAWVETYDNNFKTRCEDTQNYHASVFPSVWEEVAWAVAGFLLAWRIAVAPQVGSVEYSAGISKYLLQGGKETSVTIDFLKNQVELLAKREPLE